MKISSDLGLSPLADSLQLSGGRTDFQVQMLQTLRTAQPQLGSEAKDSAKTERAAKEDKKLKTAAEEFEAFFLAHMFKQMRKTVPESDLFGDGNDREVFLDLLDDERAKDVAKGRGFGLAEQLYSQLRPTSQKKLPSLTDNRIQAFLNTSGG